MAGLLCDSCGAINPPGNQVCQHCQASLEDHLTQPEPISSDGDVADQSQEFDSTGHLGFPVDDHLSSERHDSGHKQSPLAELGDVIPIETIVEEISKPKPYSLKIRVTDAQQTNIRLLEKLTRTEAGSRPTPKTSNITTQQFIRFLIMLFLILAISWPIFFDTPHLPLPAADSNVSSFSQHILSLPLDAPVLLAFDYEPGYASELDTSATAVLDQLMSRNAYLTLVSTSTSGAIQAERAISIARAKAARIYETPTDYVNLGYIPGGATGLISLSTGIRSTFPLSINGDQVWQSPALQDVNTPDDFNLVIVITDSSATARTWVEQVQPNLINTPLLMITSAQVEPLIRPYFDSDPAQVDGLIVGLAGSVSYETFTGRIKQASNLWGSFSMSVMAAAGLILFGGMVSAILAAYKREQDYPGGE